MKVAIIHNKDSKVINTFGMQNKEKYNVKTVNRVAESLESYGHNVEVIDGNMSVIESIQGFMPKVMDGEKMGMVFNMAYESCCNQLSYAVLWLSLGFVEAKIYWFNQCWCKF